LPPHLATVIQPKRAPHAATVTPATPPPHAATIMQAKRAPHAAAAKPPRGAATLQRAQALDEKQVKKAACDDENMVATLQAISLLLLAYAKVRAKEQGAGAPNEVQAMRLDGQVFVSTNGTPENEPIVDLFAWGDYSTRKGMGSAMKLMLETSAKKVEAMEETTLKNSVKQVERLVDEVARRSRFALEDGQVALIPHMPRWKGTLPIKEMGKHDQGFAISGTPDTCVQSLHLEEPTHIYFIGGDGKLHAEQQLVRTLAHCLRKDIIPELDVVIYGVKSPCKICFRVLQAFKAAYEGIYPSRILFDDFNKGRNNVNEKTIHAYELMDDFKAAAKEETKFGDLVRAYKLK
jgi:hypothetical protein